mmetsp:Transcript_125/g.430  ORF Transcript_125/g.430 Transcript_125/m.430 type:complete len:197 (+) Transcript_125:298-888(+)
MGEAPFKSPCCCLLGGCPFTCLCTTFHMRYKALNHVTPGSGWDHYICCQGYFPKCCCFTPGSCGEKSLPRTCMCCEACCCPGIAISSTRFVIMDNYALTPDVCDNRLIRFNNCIQILSCICHILACIDGTFREAAQIVDCIADVVFFTTAGCMTAQTNFEMDYRSSLNTATATVITNGGAPPAADALAPDAEDIKR